MAGVERARAEAPEKPEDAVRKILRLKRSLAAARSALARERSVAQSPAVGACLRELAAEMQSWDEQLEHVRADLADLIAERDRWQIAHDKLRERIEHHSIEPRSESGRKPESARMQTARVQPRMPEEPQDYSTIDQELARLNASMLRAFSE